MRQTIPIIISLVVIFALTLASTDPRDWLVGAVIAVTLYAAFRQVVFPREEVNPDTPGSRIMRTIWFFPFAFALIRDIVTGTVQVMAIVLGITREWTPGIVAVPIGDRTRTGVAVSGIATTLAPGTVLVDVDWERGVMWIHAIEAGDPDLIRERHQQFYERYQQRVFP